MITVAAIAAVCAQTEDVDQVRILAFATGGNIRFMEHFAKHESLESALELDTFTYGNSSVTQELGISLALFAQPE